MTTHDAIGEIERLRDRKYRTPRGMRHALNGRDRVLLDYVIDNLMASAPAPSAVQELEALKAEVMELHARECDSLNKPEYLDALHHVREAIDARLSRLAHQEGK